MGYISSKNFLFGIITGALIGAMLYPSNQVNSAILGGLIGAIVARFFLR